MSCDFGVWYPTRRLDDAQAGDLYLALCEEDLGGVEPHPALDAFYAELTARHPEIDDVAEDQVDDTELCPWSCAFDRSPGHLILSCVWSRAEYVEALVRDLAQKHGLVLFDPQSDTVTYPGGSDAERRPERPWWRFW